MLRSLIAPIALCTEYGAWPACAETDVAIPIVPVGDDAYLMWDRWPYHRIGVRSYLRSTHDRTGGNRDADASHFLY